MLLGRENFKKLEKSRSMSIFSFYHDRKYYIQWKPKTPDMAPGLVRA